MKNMKNERKFYKCEHCGNILSLLEDKGVPVVCCGEKMKPLIANTIDASKEKHVPVITREGDTFTVKVGAVPHPMLPEHHIAWILVASGNYTARVALPLNSAPEATFVIPGAKSITAYEYCNLHGLWASDSI